MFDFISKLFTPSGSKIDSGLPTKQTPSGSTSSEGPAAEQKNVEQARQAWRQKVDAAAHNETVILDLLFACEHAEGRLYAAQYLHSQAALEQTKARFKKSDQRVVKLAQARLEVLRQQTALTQAGQACIDQAQALLDAGVILPNQLIELDQARSKIASLGVLPADLSDAFASLRHQLDTLIQQQVQLQRSMLDAAEQLKAALHNKPHGELNLLQELQARVKSLCQSPLAASLPRPLLREAEQLVAQAEAAQASRLLQVESESRLAPPKISESEASPSSEPQNEQADEQANEQNKAAGFEKKVEYPVAQQHQENDARSLADGGKKVTLGPKDFMTALEGLEQALQDGRSQLARQFEKTLQELDPSELPDYVTKAQRQRLNSARKEFSRLMSWARWSGVASREELVATAEGLAQLRLGPTEIVDTVTALRAQWKQIEEVGGAGSKELWSRFDAACSAAHAPAAAHFQEQALARKANADRARAMLQQAVTRVHELMCEPYDWRLVSNSLAQMRQEWRQLGVIERKEKQTLELEWNTALQPLESALQAQRELAQQERAQLIDAVKHIDAGQRDAVDRIRSLQQRWQQCAAQVPLERKHEQELWNVFRAACDQVFDVKKAHHLALEQERLQHLEAKQTLCEQFEKLLLKNEIDGISLSTQLRTFEQQWHAIGEVPRREEKAMADRYHQLFANGKTRIQDLNMQRQSAQLARLRQTLQACFALELGAEDSSLDAEIPAQAKDLGSKSVQQRVTNLKTALQHGMSTSDFSQQTQTMAQTLLQLEILWELDSPQEEQDARRQLQLQMLQQSLKEGRDPRVEQNLFTKLISTPSAPALPLQARILRILDAGLARWPMKAM